MSRVKVDSELSEQIKVEVRMHQGSVLSPFPFEVLIDVTVFVIEGMLSEILCVDGLFLMSETTEGLGN